MHGAWLKCTIVKGMFRDELAVTCRKKDGEFISEFIPKEFVSGEVNGEGVVRVRVYRDGDTSWAVLPTEYRAAIPIHEADLILS